MTAMVKGCGHLPAGVYDVERIRADFPILVARGATASRSSISTTAPPRRSRARCSTPSMRAYSNEYANVHRGLHYLSNAATAKFEDARETVRRFLNAPSTDEIIFTRNVTEAINLVAASYGMDFKAGDEIVLSIMEHHSNIVPWHFHRERKGCVLKWAPISDDGEFLLDEFEKLLTPRTRIVALTHMSNVLGTVVPIKEVIRLAHARGIPVLVDGAQAAVHMPVDVQDLDCDFYAFTGHKTYGPTGIGVLYAKKQAPRRHAALPGRRRHDRERAHRRASPTASRRTSSRPARRRSCRPSGSARRSSYMMQVGRDSIAAHEAELQDYAHARLGELNWLQDPRHGQGQGRDRLLQHRRPAPARHLDHHRPFRRGGAGRPSLRAAADGAARRDGDLPRVVRHVQHQGRGGCPGRGPHQGARVLRVTRTTDGRQTMSTMLMHHRTRAAPPRRPPKPSRLAARRGRSTPDGGAGAAHRRHRRGAQDRLRPGNSGRHLRAGPDLQDRRGRRAQRRRRHDADRARAARSPARCRSGWRTRSASVAGVGQVTVKLTFDPPWDQSRMSDEAKLLLGMLTTLVFGAARGGGVLATARCYSRRSARGGFIPARPASCAGSWRRCGRKRSVSAKGDGSL